MIQDLYTVKETSEMISGGKTLLLAGSREALSGLPSGNWIAGTTPHFMASNRRRITSQEQIFVHQLPDFITGVAIKEYNESDIRNIYTDAPENGFTILIAPNSSKVLFEYALKAPDYPKFACSPVCGWVAGWLVKDLPDRYSYCMSGLNPVLQNNNAIAMHVSLPANKYAEISMFSPFKETPGTTIVFDEDGWVLENAVINGVEQNFATYILEKGIDTTYPLIANFAGAQVCVSYFKIEGNKVYLYAPVFKGIEYHHSEIDLQATELELSGGEIVYSMSCILNFQHPELCDTYIEKMNGPITFGEIAYQLVNQTTVYLTVENTK